MSDVDDCGEINGETSKYQLQHLVTYVEEEHHLEPEEIMAQVVELDQNVMSPVNCTLELNQNGLKVVIDEKEDILEESLWESVYDQAVISDLEENSKRILLIFRVLHKYQKEKGLPCDLLVFNAPSESLAKEIVDKLINYQQNQALSVLSRNLSSISEQQIAVPLKYSEEKITSPELEGYGSSFYMLNRCLDDIDDFRRRLNSSLRSNHVKQKENESGSPKRHLIEPPGSDEAVNVLRKVKFSLNTTHEIKRYIPEVYENINCHLVKFVRWLGKLCKDETYLGYSANLISEIVEPLLHTQVLDSLRKSMSPKARQFWEDLGPSWNIPSEQWPNPIENYIPEFKHDPSEYRKNRTLEQPANKFNSEVPRSKSLDIAKSSTYNTENDLRKNFYDAVTSRGGILCYATSRNVGSKPQDLVAYHGEIFELIGDPEADPLTVRNYAGKIGEIPKSQLKILPHDHNPLVRTLSRSGSQASVASSHLQSNIYESVVMPSPQKPRKTHRDSRNRDRTLNSQASIPMYSPIGIYMPPDFSKMSPVPSTPMVLVPLTTYSHHRSHTKNACVQTGGYAYESFYFKSNFRSPYNNYPLFANTYSPTLILRSRK